MKYLIIFSITIILSLIIMFYHPYLDVYTDSVTIAYDEVEEDYSWSYEISNDNLKLVKEGSNNWKYIPNKNGIVELTYYYKKNNEEDFKYKIYYKFRVFRNKIFWLEGEGLGLYSYPNPY